jgi:hypothetical protein
VTQLAPQEEKYSDERDWKDRLSDCQGGSTGKTTIRDRFGMLICHAFNGWRATLVEDLEFRLLLFRPYLADVIHIRSGEGK